MFCAIDSISDEKFIKTVIVLWQCDYSHFIFKKYLCTIIIYIKFLIKGFFCNNLILLVTHHLIAWIKDFSSNGITYEVSYVKNVLFRLRLLLQYAQFEAIFKEKLSYCLH